MTNYTTNPIYLQGIRKKITIRQIFIIEKMSQKGRKMTGYQLTKEALGVIIILYNNAAVWLLPDVVIRKEEQDNEYPTSRL